MLYKQTELDVDAFYAWLDVNPKIEAAYITYCEYDVISLSEIWTKFGKIIRDMINKILEHNPNMRKAKSDCNINKKPTLPSLSKTILEYKNYKESEKKYFGEGMEKYFNTLNDAITGGISHVSYAGKITDILACLDVVSLYPFVMLNFGYPQGTPVETNEYQGNKLGIYQVENVKLVKSNIVDVPTLKKDRLDWSETNCTKKYLTNICIERIRKRGGTLDVIDGIYWEKTWQPFEFLNVFKEEKCRQDTLKKIYGSLEKQVIECEKEEFSWSYDCDIDKLSEYQKRTKPTLLQRLENSGITEGELYDSCKNIELPNSAMRETCKLLMNSLYGKMLERQVNYTFIRIEDIKYDEDGSMGYMKNNKFIAVENHDLVENNGSYSMKIREENTNNYIHFGVFILAYSKYVMASYMDLVGRDYIVASETDSIYFPNQLLSEIPDSVDHKNYDKDKPWMMIGKEFGNMEIEYSDITDALFLGKKCCNFTKSLKRKEEIEKLDASDKEQEITKNTKMTFKGVPKANLDRAVYETLYEKGRVVVENINVFQRKLFDCNESGIWVGKGKKIITAQMELKEHTLIQWI